jgi:PPOX class probable FMN-dependent enzyme
MTGKPIAFVESEAELREIYPGQSELVKRKVMPALDRHGRRFIELAPFACVATFRPDGGADVSPKGDAPGFVAILDERTLFLPDRVGNNRLDTLSNVLSNPAVALIFLIPGVEETFRVQGRGRVVRDEGFLARFAVNGKAPRTGLLVEVEECFLHCSKALKRSKLWGADYKVDRKAALPSLGKMIADQQGGDPVVFEEAIQESLRTRMY